MFLDYNTRGIFAYKRAADALVRILPLGISHPVAFDLLGDARDALLDVARWNQILFDTLDTQRFFYCVRPYYKPYKVGLHEYRGANAGDFSGINEVDLLLGLCNANNISYSQLLVDKFLFMMPEDQARLRDCMRRQSLMDALLAQLPGAASQDWFQRNARLFLEVCKAHGTAAAQHHDQLVRKFIEAALRRAARAPPHAHHRQRAAAARCCSARWRSCATCAWRRRGTTSPAATGTSSRCSAASGILAFSRLAATRRSRRLLPCVGGRLKCAPLPGKASAPDTRPIGSPILSKPAIPSHARVVVVGGGVIGTSVAYHLALLGWKDIVLLERDRLTSGTTWHAAGLMVTFGSTSETSTEMRKYTRDLYSRLEAETGQATGFAPIGFIEVAADRDRLEEYRRVSAFNRYCGVDVHEISPREVQGAVPARAASMTSRRAST